MTVRASLLILAAMILSGLAVFFVWQRAIARPLVGLVAAGEMLDALRASLVDQRRLAAAFPEEEAAIRERFAETETLYRRLHILEHNRDALQRRYEAILGSVVFGVLLVAGGVHLAGRALDRRRLRTIEEALVDLASGKTDIEVGLRGRGPLPAIGRMVERISASLSRQRARLSSLENLERWQGAARRHAHEMKTPLTSARLVLDRLEDELAGGGVGGADTGDDVRRVRRDLQRLEELTRGFAEFARLPAPQLEPLDLAAVAREVAEIYAGVWKGAPIVHRTPHPAPIRGDRGLVEQLLVNLLDNAARAQQLGGTEGAVEVAVETAGDTAVLEVRDRGPGVPPELVQTLFEPYVTSRRGQGGTGLGLPIARKIALDHGGDLELAGTGSEGAIFRLSLPLDAGRRGG